MCGGGKKAPAPTETQQKIEQQQTQVLANQLKEQEQRQEEITIQKDVAQAEKADTKKKVLQDTVAKNTGVMGYRSLISGRRGGMGYGRELLG
jgi:hypothetical protein